jgi:hypothetical protein
MALPTILFNSSTGSDSAASGAGPATALTGTSASTSSDGLTVTLDGSPSLTGVATDGSHVIYLNHSAGRNFGKITGKDDSAKTVTVSDAFTGSLTAKSWAIGGKRLTLAGTASKKLTDNGGAAGDAMPGWILEMESGYTETIAATVDLRRAGDVTSGPIIIRGTSGAATKPIVTFSNNGNGFVARAVYLAFVDFDIRNSNATKTASVAINNGSSLQTTVTRVRIAESGSKFFRGISSLGTGSLVQDCEIGNCAEIGIHAFAGNRIMNCWIHGNTSSGITSAANISVVNCIIEGNGAAGVSLSSASSGSAGGGVIANNTFDSNTGDGLYLSGNSLRTVTDFAILNNIFSNNTGYGVEYLTLSAIAIEAYGHLMRGNAFYNNTSGDTLPSPMPTNLSATTATNPAYVNAAAGNFAIGTALKSKGYPVGGTNYVGTTSTTYSYADPGAAGREEPAGGGGTVYVPQGGGGIGIWRS